MASPNSELQGKSPKQNILKVVSPFSKNRYFEVSASNKLKTARLIQYIVATSSVLALWVPALFPGRMLILSLASCAFIFIVGILGSRSQLAVLGTLVEVKPENHLDPTQLHKNPYRQVTFLILAFLSYFECYDNLKGSTKLAEIFFVIGGSLVAAYFYESTKRL